MSNPLDIDWTIRTAQQRGVDLEHTTIEVGEEYLAGLPQLWKARVASGTLYDIPCKVVPEDRVSIEGYTYPESAVYRRV